LDYVYWMSMMSFGLNCFCSFFSLVRLNNIVCEGSKFMIVGSTNGVHFLGN
jgi:hypothetical protein